MESAGIRPKKNALISQRVSYFTFKKIIGFEKVVILFGKAKTVAQSFAEISQRVTRVSSFYYSFSSVNLALRRSRNQYLMRLTK